MQDSIEDYIRMVRNTKEVAEPPKQVNKEVLVTAQANKECDVKALQIVEFSIEGKLRSQVFLKCLSFIHQSHYQDIVEERAVMKLCGYPICGRKIPDMPKKQYHISTKTNRIYDITDRKNFCSNYCYNASSHIKKQIEDTPLWLRKCDQIPRFDLLQKTERTRPGEEVDQGLVRATPEAPCFNSVSSFAHLSLDEIEENEVNPEESESDGKSKKCKRISKHHLHKSMKTISENDEDDSSDKSREKPFLNKAIPEDSEDKETFWVAKPTIKKKTVWDRKEENVEEKISKCLKEWITLETLLYIYGENRVKAVINDEKLSSCFESLKISELEVNNQRKYLEICRRLHLKQISDEEFDDAVVGRCKLEPLPDYKQLKQENKLLDLKVKSFYSGVLKNIEENSASSSKKTNEDENGEEGPPAVLPLVDGNSQNALRRKIFLTSLKRPFQRLLDSLDIEDSKIFTDLHNLVKTFALKADNIVFKPISWPVLSILLLKILCLKDAELHEILEKESSKEILNSSLNDLPSKGEFVGDLLNLIENFDKFIEIYICNK